MDKKWKSASAVGIAMLIGCLLPMGTMMAAEGDTGTVQESGLDSVSGNGIISEIEMPEDTDVETMVSARKAASEEQQADLQIAAQAEDSAAPVIEIKWQGQDWTRALGGTVEYIYLNPYGQAIECYASQEGQAVTIYQCLDNVGTAVTEAKGEQEAESLLAGVNGSQSFPVQVIPLNEGKYILYVKAEGADGQISYARSDGIVIDTTVPKITGIVDGQSYPEGTSFKVEDDNLESVKVNEQLAVPEADGSYRVVANGSSCVIKVKDKAGNETTCSITVSGKNPAADGNVISASGRYTLKAGTEYTLGAGTWQLDGDSTVYRGGRTFYVEDNGDYRFTKR